MELSLYQATRTYRNLHPSQSFATAELIYAPQSQQKQPAALIAVPSLPSTAPTPAPVTVAPNATTGPSSSTLQVPSTPVQLTLAQQHITAVEGLVPTLQNIVATMNLDCRLDGGRLCLLAQR